MDGLNAQDSAVVASSGGVCFASNLLHSTASVLVQEFVIDLGKKFE